MNQGLFLVIEGSDGSGKETQCKLVIDRLKKEGYDVELFDFPQYKKESSYFIREYLNGKYGTAEEVGPYTGSLFYALDRYQAAPDIKKALAEGKIVIANRFTGSNMAHQGAKIENDEQRKGYFLWLDAIEFQMLGIPRPDMSLVLSVPAEVAQKLVDNKDERSYTDKKRDLHEADLSHLQQAVKVYSSLSDIFPKDFKQLDCVRSGKLLSIEAIHKLIWETIHPLLPTKPAKTSTVKSPLKDKPMYYIPDELDEQTTKSYMQIMDSILSLHSKMLDTLTTELSAEEAEEILQAVLPVATLAEESLAVTEQTNSGVEKLADTMLKETYSADNTSVKLCAVSCRNELDIVADILYEHSTQPYEVIHDQVDTWPYENKAKVLQAYMKNPGNTLEKIQYSWDIICEYSTLHSLKTRKIGSNLHQQQLSPRYGYAVPTILENVQLTDDYEQCFDLSLKLYSILQATKYPKTAALATLLGHRQRFLITLNAKEVTSLTDGIYSPLTNLMYTKVKEIHPLVSTLINGR